jgi:hypothetical protein
MSALIKVIIGQLGPERSISALRRSDYEVIVLAADVCKKAERFRAEHAKLTNASIIHRWPHLLGDAVRVSVLTLNEPLDYVWEGIVGRTRACARVLHETFLPASERDAHVVNDWLSVYVD